MKKSLYQRKVTFLQITNKCNATCLMCDIWKRTPLDLDLNKIIFQLDYINSLFPGSEIRLTGGEPCLHEQFLQIIEEIDKRSLHKSIITNGSLFSLLKKKYISFDRIFLSIDTTNPEVQQTIRGLKLRVPSNPKSDIIANVIISKLNKLNIYEIPEWLAQNKIKMINIIPMKHENYSLPDKEYLQVLSQLLLSCKKNNIKHFIEDLNYPNGVDVKFLERNINNINSEVICKIQNMVRFITIDNSVYNCNSTPHRLYSNQKHNIHKCSECKTFNSGYCDLSNQLYNSLLN